MITLLLTHISVNTRVLCDKFTGNVIDLITRRSDYPLIISMLRSTDILSVHEIDIEVMYISDK